MDPDPLAAYAPPSCGARSASRARARLAAVPLVREAEARCLLGRDNGAVADADSESALDPNSVGVESGGIVEQVTFGTRSRNEIDAFVDQLCVGNLGAGIAEVLFRETSVGVVTGIALTYSRRVVVKVHQPRESQTRLQAIHDVQARLHRRGFPCPEPLIDPIAVGRGHATAETLLDAGARHDLHLDRPLAWRGALEDFPAPSRTLVEPERPAAPTRRRRLSGRTETVMVRRLKAAALVIKACTSVAAEASWKRSGA
jgi:hypothetical protein